MKSLCSCRTTLIATIGAGAVLVAASSTAQTYIPDRFDDSPALPTPSAIIPEAKVYPFVPEMLPCKYAEEVTPPQEYSEGLRGCNKEPCAGEDPPPNDDCEGAIAISGSLPAIVDGTTCGATSDVPAPSCSNDTPVSSSGPGVWYTVIGTGGLMTATTCDGVHASATADFDTKISVYCSECSSSTVNLRCVTANNDDDANGCGNSPPQTGSRRSTASWCSELNVEYLILVHGSTQGMPWLPPQGDFTMVILSGGTCLGVVQCGEDNGELECPQDATLEGEPTCQDFYIDVFNGGCNSDPPVFTNILCGETICGESGTFIGPAPDNFNSRDTDWLRFTIASPQVVTIDVTAEFPVIFGVIDTGGVDACPGAPVFLDFTMADALTPATLNVNLTPGTWFIFLASQDFAGVPCGSAWVATLTCIAPPTGACCLENDANAFDACQDGFTEIECIMYGGCYQGDDTTCDSVNCDAPSNDLCEDAIYVEVPSITAGTTIGATTDSDASDCGSATITSPGVWYKLLGTGSFLSASTCDDADYDTKVSVFCGDCPEPICIGGNDDSCGFRASVEWCSQAGAEYLILVHGFNGATGNFDLTVSDHGGTCKPDVLCVPVGACCFDDCSCIETTEDDCVAMGGDYQGDDVPCGLRAIATGYEGFVCTANGLFEDITATGTELFLGDDNGEIVPIGFTFNFYGDDHFNIAVCSNGYLTFGTDLSDFSEDPIPNPDEPNNFIAPLWDDLSPNNGGTVHYETRGTAPNRRFIAQWTNVPEFVSTGSNTFQAILFEGTLDIEFHYGAISATDGGVGVENQDGTEGTAFNGVESSCLMLDAITEMVPIADLQAEECANSFIDISGTGIQIFLGDDDGLFVPIGFTFNFFGDDHTDIAVCSNGYLTFGGDLTDFSNDPIPTATDPNDIICPLWDDLLPGGVGTVHYETIGTAPNRVFIAQWTNVPQFGNTDSNTFQAILLEGSNGIDFRYGAITPEAFAGDYTIGVENQDGTDGLAIIGSGVEAGQCIRISASTENPCTDTVPPDLVCGVFIVEETVTDEVFDAVEAALGNEYDVPQPRLIEVKFEVLDMSCGGEEVEGHIDIDCEMIPVEHCDRVILFCWPPGHPCPLCFSMEIAGTLVVVCEEATLHVWATDASGNSSHCEEVLCGPPPPVGIPIDEPQRAPKAQTLDRSAFGGPGR